MLESRRAPGLVDTTFPQYHELVGRSLPNARGAVGGVSFLPIQSIRHR